jgi:hypothetical protein
MFGPLIHVWPRIGCRRQVMKRKIGYRLLEALTYEELAKVFDAAFSIINPDHLDVLLSRLDGGTANTVAGLVTSKRAKPSKILSPDAKIIQQWQRLWDLWNSIAAKIGDEDGEYALRQHTWESPIFNNTQFADDLEEVCRYLLPLIELVSPLNVADPDIFMHAIIGIEKNMRDYPDWMNLDKTGCMIGTFATQCILKWTWMTSPTPEQFINRLNLLEEHLKFIQLNSQGVMYFFESLPEDHQEQIFDDIKRQENDPEWESRLNHVDSFWHQIYLNLSRRFDTRVYLDSCLKLMNENWLYGVPPLKNLLKNNQWEEAEKICHLIITRYADQEGDIASWAPETHLLAAIVKRGIHHFPDEAISDVLKDWIVATEKIGWVERNQLVRFQQLTYQNPFDWDNMAGLVQKTGLPAVSSLLAAWQQHILSVALGFKPGRGKNFTDCWINWLIEAGLDPAKGKPWFSAKLQEWLLYIQANSKAFMDQKQAFFVLTRDLAELTDIKTRFPQVVQICTDSIIGDKSHNICRREWLNKMMGSNHLPVVMECWVKYAPKMVPSPIVVIGSNYNLHVSWLAVVKELNPEAYRHILDQWQFEHSRRRKLWTTIKQKLGS